MDKKTVRWGRLTLGAGRPVVCVPVMGRDEAALGAFARSAALSGAEVIELRADSLCAMPTVAQAMAMLRTVREAAPDTPLLFTLRTQRDGGAGIPDAAAYEALLCGLLAHTDALPDALDCELSVGEEAFSRIAACAHEAGVSLVGSSHDFAKTPERTEIVRRLMDMERLGADVCKIAVMPGSRADVLTLMQAAVEADEALRAPLIAISMGPLGAITRVGSELMGSCLTFGAVGQTSAPGQMDARALMDALALLHGAM